MLIGTSGWSYQEWVGAFYPNNRAAKLPFYSKVFRTVEVDSSFYKAPSKSMISGWARAVPAKFKFSLKFPKSISHDKRLAGVERELFDFLETLRPLQDADKLGAILLQLPPSFSYPQRKRLEAFFSLLPLNIHFAVEFRHDSWNRQETWDLLKKYKIANTITDSPITFLSAPVVTTESHSFVRWHGKGSPVWYSYRYSVEELRPWVEKINEISSKVEVTYAYFNNHYEANAPQNALGFLKMTGELSEEQSRTSRRIQRAASRRTTPKTPENRQISDFFNDP